MRLYWKHRYSSTNDITAFLAVIPKLRIFLLIVSDCLKLLLKHGADPLLEKDNADTAVSVAKDAVIKSILETHVAVKIAKAHGRYQ